MQHEIEDNVSMAIGFSVLNESATDHVLRNAPACSAVLPTKRKYGIVQPALVTFYSISIGIDVTKQSDYARDRRDAEAGCKKNNRKKQQGKPGESPRTTTARHDQEEVMATFLNSVVKEGPCGKGPG